MRPLQIQATDDLVIELSAGKDEPGYLVLKSCSLESNHEIDSRIAIHLAEVRSVIDALAVAAQTLARLNAGDAGYRL